MARSAIPLYVTNQVITAAHSNTYWRDNEAAEWPFTAVGDKAYAAAGDTLSRQAIGTAGQIQRVNAAADAPVWGGIIYGSIYAAVDTTVGTAADTLVEMDTSYINIDGFVATPVNDRITIPAGFDGYYLANYYVEIDASAVGYRTVKLRKNAGLVDIDNTIIRMKAVDGGDTCISGVAIIHADAADYITICVYQNSGGNLDVENATLSLSLMLGD